MSNHIKDMTKGEPARLILSFAFPLMVGNIFQQLYTIVDTMVVGKFVGVEALASLGAADWLSWMVLGIVVGFTQGFSLLISQKFGSGEKEALNKAISMALSLEICISIVLTLGSLITIRPLLHLLNTPVNVFDGAVCYLTIIFSGIVCSTAYNAMASILRALGDSKTPLVAMIIASAINIGLDLLLVIVFSFGIAGVAIATIIAQTFSFLYCAKKVSKLKQIQFRKEYFKPDWGYIKTLFYLGTPMAFQNIIIGVGGLVVQYVVNGFGFIFVAGFTATNKLNGLLELAATSFGFSIATYTGQNLGAGRTDRIKDGVKVSVFMAIVTSIIISLIVIILGKPILMMFISGNMETVNQVLTIAYRYLCVMAIFLSILYLLYVYRSALQGMGDTIIPMLSGIVELIMRVSAVFILPVLMGETGVYFAEIAAWSGATILLIVSYYRKISSNKYSL